MTLTELCSHIRNWFVRSEANRHHGVFTIADGSLVLSDGISIADGQYIRIVGSAFADGVHQYPAAFPRDEVFGGEIWVMSVPSEVLTLCDEITSWQDKYAEAAASPFASESFGGYSYTKSGGASITGTSGVINWQTQFKARLNQWRKL